MPALTARVSVVTQAVSSPLIRIPPVSPPPKAISEISRPVRPSKVFRIPSRYHAPKTTRQFSCTWRLRTQPETLNLAGCRLRQVAAKLDPARVLVGRELGLAMLLQRQHQLITSAVRRLEHDESLRLDQRLLVRPRHHGCFEHIRVALQRAFDLERRDVDAADFQHVVTPPAVDIVAVLVLQVLVTGACPFAQEGRARLVTVVPVHDRAGRAAYLQLTHRA